MVDSDHESYYRPYSFSSCRRKPTIQIGISAGARYTTAIKYARPRQKRNATIVASVTNTGTIQTNVVMVPMKNRVSRVPWSQQSCRNPPMNTAARTDAARILANAGQLKSVRHTASKIVAPIAAATHESCSILRSSVSPQYIVLLQTG